MSEWSIRSLLNPLIMRLLVYGVNPIDIEEVLGSVETQPLRNAQSLENVWRSAWETKAARYLALAKESATRDDALSAGRLFEMAAQCYYAIFLVNPADLEEKRRIYLTYAELYQKAESYYPRPALLVDVPLESGTLPGYLHLPVSSNTRPPVCAVIFPGLGSCKEEAHLLARPLVQRGMAAFVPDMPGTGEALYRYDVKCRYPVLKEAFSRIADTLRDHDELEETRIGTYGLCMGGGFAYHAAVLDSRYRFCATLFMLFITVAPEDSVPLWIRQGRSYERQTGVPPEQFKAEIAPLSEGRLTCPYLFVHGRHDNWMPLDLSEPFFERAEGPKEKLIIDDEAVFSEDQQVIHSMPVGEQLGWVKHRAADWIAKQASVE